jgi:hypothetical protein
MRPVIYDWTTYWNEALARGQNILPTSVLRLIEAARDDDPDSFAAEAGALPQLELQVAHMVFHRVEELHRKEHALGPVADAIAVLVQVLASEEAKRNAA